MSTRTFAVAACAVLALTSIAGCGGSNTAADRSTSTGKPTPSTSSSAVSSSAGSSRASAPTASALPTTVAPSAAGCVRSLVSSMSPAQKAGQLVMVGLDGSRTASSLDAMIADDHIGNIFFIGGWRDSGNVLDASDHVQQQATSASTKKVGFLIAADQEGGQVQQLKGTGFPPLPSALDQGAMPSAQRLDLTRSIGRQLKTAGVNMNLAPVADTVPPGNPRSNEPIGRWSRQYGNDPATAAAGVTDAVKGMESGGVLTTLKHFPGLGRVTGNTDFTTSGIVDNQTTADDQYLQPFRAGIAAGAGAVMVSSAYYAKIDPAHQAIFSAKVMNVLRQDLGFTGVVISDDLNAVAIRSVATGERAVQMIRAGGDIALTGLAAAGPLMAEAITLEADADPTFRAQVDASVTRVLTLKTRAGLTPCSSAG